MPTFILNTAGVGTKAVALTAPCIDDGTPRIEVLHLDELQVLAAAPSGLFSNTSCQLAAGANTCTSVFTVQPTNMHWACLWAKSQTSQSAPDQLLACFNQFQNPGQSWNYDWPNVRATLQRVELRGYGGNFAPTISAFDAASNPILQTKDIQASSGPVPTARFTAPCLTTSTSVASPCNAYIATQPAGDVNISWESYNYSGAIEIRRYKGVDATPAAANCVAPNCEVLRTGASASGSLPQVEFLISRIDELHIIGSVNATPVVLGRQTVRAVFDACKALPARVPPDVSASCGKTRDASLSFAPAQVCTIAPSDTECIITATVYAVSPAASANNCIFTGLPIALSQCGPEGFSRELTARPYESNVQANQYTQTPLGTGCQLSQPYTYCARYSQPSTGSLTALPCAFNGSNCTTTFSATKSSALRSCLWRKDSATTATKLACNEGTTWSLPGWSGSISGPTVIELRASNDRIEPTQYNPAQNLLASVTLQTCFGPGQFPATPGIPNLAASTNLLSFPVSWTAISGACEYVLQRQIGTGAWVNRQTGIGTELLETVAGPGQYSYRVKACNSAANQSECSAYSPIASINVATDQQIGFTQPCGLNVAACSVSTPAAAGSSVTIAWNQNFLAAPRVDETDLSTNITSVIASGNVSSLVRTLLGGRSYRYRLFDGTNLLKTVDISMVVPAGQFSTPCALSSGLCTLSATSAGTTQSFSLGWSTQNVANATVTEQALPSGAVTTLSGASPQARTINVGTTYRYRLLNGINSLATMDVLIAQDLPESLNPPQFANAPSEDLASTAVGATSGTAKVDESGNFNYSVPIMLGKGVGDFKPVFALNYASGRGLGRAGMGWDLQGQEAITPCRKAIESGDGYNDGKPYTDVSFDGSDQFCLNGSRLFLASGTGTYGSVGSFYKTEFDRYQRIRVLSSDAKGPVEWRVESPDGTSKYFGGTARRLEPDVSAPQSIRAVAWPMRLIQNSVGRSITYSYGQGNSDQWLTRVDFDGGAVTFQYLPLGFQTGYTQQFQGGIKFAMAQRLTGVTVFSPPTLNPTISPDVTELRRYQLTHARVNETVTAGDENPALQFVTAVRECVGAICYRAATFNYAKQSFATETFTNQPAEESSTQRFGDINGDGRADLVVRRNSSPNDIALYMARSKAEAPFAGANPQWYQEKVRLPDTGIPDAIFLGATPYEAARSLHLSDLNSDGREDLIYLHVQTIPVIKFAWRARLSNGTGFDTVDTDLVSDANSSEIVVQATQNRKAQLQFSDLNGDGLEDMVYPGANNTFVARLLQKPEGQLVAKYGPEIDLNFFNEAGLGCTSLSAAFAKLNHRRLEIFDANGDGFGDFVLRATSASSTGCRSLSGDQMSVQQLDRAQFPSSVPVAAGEKPRTATSEYIYVFLNEGRDCPNSGNTGAPSNSTCTAPQKFRVAEKLQVAGDGALLSSRDDLVRFTDINGDGLADLSYVGKAFAAQATQGWMYRLNSGNKITSPGQKLFNGATGCMAFDPTTTCKVIGDLDDVQLVDMDEDGRLDYVRLTGNAQIYNVRYWTGDGFSGTDEPLTFAGHNENELWRQFFIDLDGDGHLDLTEIKVLGNPYMSVQRRVTHHKARHSMESVTNGLGASSYIDYQPLTYRSVYARSYDGPTLLSGRGSPVLDAMGATWVVASLSSDSPSIDLATNLFNADRLASIFYRYGGLKMQTGGRGSLGFRHVYSYDPQNKIAALTQYSQAFPYTGIAEQTLSWVVPSMPAEFSLCTITALQTQENSGCFGYGSENLVPPSGTQLLSDMSDTTFISILGQHVTLALMRNHQSSFEVTASGSENFKFDLNGQVLSSTGENVDLSLGAATSTSTNFWGTGFGGSNRAIESTQNSQNTYLQTVDPNRWFLNRLTSTSTHLHLPGVNDYRYANFTYNQSNGLIASESIGNPALSTKHFCRDSFGNITKTIAQSGSLAVPNCASFGAANVLSASTDSSTNFARMTTTGYDLSGRFALSQQEVVNSARGLALVTISETKQDGARPAFDAFGNPHYVETINGAKARSAYNRFGEKYFSSSNTGTSMVVRRRWCDDAASDLRCPIGYGAVFVTESKTAGAPTSWVYNDILGREILSIKEGYSATQFVAVRSYYDQLNRTAKVSEPYFSFSPAASSGGLPGAAANGVQYWSESYFDALGRITKIIAPNGARTTTQYAGLSTTITHPINGSNQIETKTETKDLLGRVKSVSDALGNQVSYEYWNLKDLKSLTTTPVAGEAGTVTSFVIDEFGRRTSSSDPNKGNYTFVYNDAGEVVQQIASDGSCMLALHDFAGRVTERFDVAAGLGCAAGNAYQKTLTSYDLAANGVGQAQNVQLIPLNGGTDQESNTFVFDSFGRSISTTQRIQNERTYTMQAKFDEYGRPAQNFFSAAAGSYFGVSRPAIPVTGEHMQYTVRGYPEQLRSVFRTSAAVPGQIYRETKAVDARGNVTEEVFGNNAASMTVFRGYADSSGWLERIKSGAASNSLTNPTFGALQDLLYSFDLQGNVSSRSDRSASQSTNEAFSYDKLQRLTGAVRNGTSEAMTYYNTGNIKSKYNISGEYFYDRFAPASCSAVVGSATPGAFALTRIGSTESFCYDSRGNQLASFLNNSIKREISYSSFDAATVIRSTTPRSHVTRFNYGAGHQRLRRYDIDGSNLSENAAGKVTHYAGDAEVTAKPDGSTEVRRYVSGMTQVQLIPASGAVLTRREYLMTDALGSTHRIVSEAGVIVTEGKQAFATFGERANADDRSTLSESQQANFNAVLPRGYTGHQQADEVGVIHMNGRIYDPRLGRFLQADSLIEDIFDPQAINSYSYVRNNPMNATDPTGHWRAKEQMVLRQIAAIVIMVTTGVNISGALANSCVTNAVAFSLAAQAAIAGAASGALTTGTLKGTLLGALSAFTFHQIGIAALSPGERVFAHALAGGTLEALGGGKFGHGFISAGLGKALSPLADSGNVAVDGAINAAIGGTVSEITGGDFANGAVMAAAQYAFNALAQNVWAPSNVPSFGAFWDWLIQGPDVRQDTGAMINDQLLAELSQHYTAEQRMEHFAIGLSFAVGAGPLSTGARVAGEGTVLLSAQTIRVGRWMSESEFTLMRSSGRLVESRLNGVTSVSSPPNSIAWSPIGPRSPVYAEFNLPSGSIRASDGVWGKVYGPNSIFGRKLGITEMPSATNITRKK